ncbi:MAG: V-type ATP synthase subunit B [Deltaproteobacteria bacterium]|nr:V-type ATP synthase subunit B [Deltaproteobacteria bacterium]
MRTIYNKIRRVSGNVIMVQAEGVGFGELAMVAAPGGSSLAEVIKIEDNRIFLQVFGGSSGISTGSEVQFLGHGLKVAFSENLLGRVFNGIGEPRDKGPRFTDNLIEITGEPVNPAKRVIPHKMIHTGIPMIDLFNSLVESQKISIFTSAGEPYNALLSRVALQAQVDIILLGGMGVRFDDYLFLKNALEEGGALTRSILFIHTAAEPVAECLMVPDLCLAVAEAFALEGKNVLVLLTDMTNFCDALKEVAISMEQVPANRGYPGDLYSQLAARYEKAVDFEEAGSVTILSVTTMPGNDVTHPVPDNTGYITEGQYYLNNGRIEPFGSLSRLKQLVNKDSREDHRAIMDGMVHLYADYQETLEKKAMGFRMSAWDNKLLDYGTAFERELLDLSVNIPLAAALDRSWQILSACFKPQETGLSSELIDKFWPVNDEKSKVDQDRA